MNRHSLLVLVVSIVSVLAGILLYRTVVSSPQLISARVSPDTDISKAAPKLPPMRFNDIILKDLAYKPRHLSEWKQPVLVINFWAPWCAPCRREVPALIELQKANAEKMTIIGLSFDAVENVVNFQQKYSMNYPLLLVQSESTQINQFFGNDSRALPFTAILNAQREIVYRHNGEITQAQLQQQIDNLF
jgi:thiol-disulfide isomerase/thioredoxin